MDQYTIQGGVEIFLVASCCRNREKLQSSGLLDHMQTLPFTSLIGEPCRVSKVHFYLVFPLTFNRHIKVKFTQIPHSTMDPLSRKLRYRHFCPFMKFHNLHFLFLGVYFIPKRDKMFQKVGPGSLKWPEGNTILKLYLQLLESLILSTSVMESETISFLRLFCRM